MYYTLTLVLDTTTRVYKCTIMSIIIYLIIWHNHIFTLGPVLWSKWVTVYYRNGTWYSITICQQVVFFFVIFKSGALLIWLCNFRYIIQATSIKLNYISITLMPSVESVNFERRLPSGALMRWSVSVCCHLCAISACQ